LVRVRFPPSPTGRLHVGGARTALFNWLFARKSGGAFILRIEDTDRTRSSEEYVKSIMDGLRWLGIDWDEGPDVGGNYGPYIQSQRVHIYQKYARILLEIGAAYKCYCSQERLERMRKEQEARKEPPRYDRACRNLSDEERERLERQGIKPVIRLKVPLDGVTGFVDMIRGRIEFENKTLEDLVLLKSDGFPTYHLANVVDDHLMEITHVMRGEEWISSTPKHVLIYKAFGWDPPNFAHLPIILAPDRSKLSKRHGAVSIEEFRDQGYLKEAMINYLALMGWSYDDKTEIFSVDELIEKFSIERVGKAAAIFDIQKLQWMNGFYIRRLPLDRLVDLCIPYLRRAGLIGEELGEEERDYIRRVVALEQERLKLLSEISWLVEFFFKEEIEYDPQAVDKVLRKEGAIDILKKLIPRLEDLQSFDASSVESCCRALIAELGIKGGDLIHPVRVAITGRTFGPGLFDVMATLGKERTIRRIEEAIRRFGG
jgi:nondiscriminating glutamyl-tRNA synthetase